MKEKIMEHLNDPKQLESLYRANKVAFKREFIAIYPEIKDFALAGYWNERLNYTNNEISWGTRNDLIFVIVVSIIAGLIAKLPALFSINEDFFYPRNIGFVVFPALLAFFAWKNKLAPGKIVWLAGALLIGLMFINLFPNVKQSDTLILSCVHLVLFLWSALGIAFVGTVRNDNEKRLNFLKYNGDLVVMTTLIVLAGGIMSAVTIGLFKLIGYDIAEIYMQNVGVFGLAAAPILGTYLTQTNPQLVGKVSPVIAKIFSPLVLVMLIVYVGAILYSGKNPYNDREFLAIFNGLLIGVMAIIFFAVAGTSSEAKNKTQVGILLALSIVTILVNGIALSAIVFRISEWGFTPNRAAVLGSNVLILINLLLVTYKLFKCFFSKVELDGVGKSIAWYLPFYCLWTIIVTFIFPFLFGFK
ncbi:hypothetical protein WG904_03040 [Pedobacter sp. Du54]|uniref:hypothetical protein n=1 Tax=Pedobacter anseongensis TaxID=3133439 RepID=UPI0030B1539A